MSGKKLIFKRAEDIKPLQIDVVNKGYIPLISAGYNILAGEGGVGKSLIALKSMVIYLLDNPMKQAIMFMTEDGIIECTSRVKTICKNMNVDYDQVNSRVFWFTLEEPEIQKLAYKGVGGLKEKNMEVIDDIVNHSLDNNVGFICFDPLRAFHELEENSNDEMPFLTREIFPRIGKITGAVILVLHHSAKGEGSQVRGASSIGNDARMAWVVSKAVEKNPMTGKRDLKKGYEDKVKLSVYKDNFNIARYCSVRDNEGMILLPTSKSVDTANGQIPVEVVEYDDKIEMGVI